MNKRRYLSDQEKADLLNAFDRLPDGRTGARGKFKDKHRLTWQLMNSWMKTPGVKKLLGAPSPQRDPMAHADLQIPKMTIGAKRQFSLKQKAWVVAAYDSLPFGSDARGHLLRKYKIYYNMISGWREELKEAGIPLPKLKVGMTMNGAGPDIVVEPHERLDIDQKLTEFHESPGAWKAKRPKAPKPEPKKQGEFHTAEDTIAWLEIRQEVERKLLEELKEHVGKTRNE